MLALRMVSFKTCSYHYHWFYVDVLGVFTKDGFGFLCRLLLYSFEAYSEVELFRRSILWFFRGMFISVKLIDIIKRNPLLKSGTISSLE